MLRILLLTNHNILIYFDKPLIFKSIAIEPSYMTNIPISIAQWLIGWYVLGSHLGIGSNQERIFKTCVQDNALEP